MPRHSRRSGWRTQCRARHGVEDELHAHAFEAPRVRTTALSSERQDAEREQAADLLVAVRHIAATPARAGGRRPTASRAGTDPRRRACRRVAVTVGASLGAAPRRWPNARSRRSSCVEAGFERAVAAHKRSCGQMRPQISGRIGLVHQLGRFDDAAVAHELEPVGMRLCSGQPHEQYGLPQSMQRAA